MIRYLLNLHLQNKSVRELSRLSDRELADVGISRVDIKAVARFAAEFTHDEVVPPLEPIPAPARVGDNRVTEGRLAYQA